MNIFTLDFFYDLLFIMFLVGLVVFIALYFIDAGYGKMRTEKWGPAMNNKVGWFLMEAPVFLVMWYLYMKSLSMYDGLTARVPYLLFFLFFEFHYFQRSFVFPFLLKGNGKMPFIIMFCSVVWNLINGYIQGYFLFHIAPSDPFYSHLYSASWLTSPQFIIGTIIFFTGWIINMHSDHVIRHLR